MIVSSNKPSSVALHQNHAIILKLKMPKIKWDGVEEPAINNFYKIDNRQF